MANNANPGGGVPPRGEGFDPYAPPGQGADAGNPYAPPGEGRDAGNPYAPPGPGSAGMPGVGSGGGAYPGAGHSGSPLTGTAFHRGPSAERWSPPWALAIAGLVTLVAVAGVGFAVYLTVTSLNSDSEYAGLGVLGAVFFIFLSLPMAAAGISYLVTKRRSLFTTTLVLASIAVMILFWSRTW